MLVLTRRSGQDIVVLADCPPADDAAEDEVEPEQRLVVVKVVSVDRYVGDDGVERARVKLGIRADGMTIYRGEVFARIGQEAQNGCEAPNP